MVKEVREIIFDETRNGLIYKNSKEPYSGNRISGIITKTSPEGYYSQTEARDNTLESLLEENENLGADAYEIVHSNPIGSWQDFCAVYVSPDQNIYRAQVAVIFYGKKDQEKPLSLNT
ncbi:MAG: hypothetical protein Q8Q01_02520 [archaeon]|nr:hypothetical protein [archaeon]